MARLFGTDSMKTRCSAYRSVVLLALSLFLLLPSASCCVNPSSSSNNDAILGVLDQFITSFNNLEWERFIALFSEDATVFFPLENNPLRASGKSKIQEIFLPFFEQVRANSEGPPYMKLTPENVLVQNLGTTAVVTFQISNPYVSSRRTLVLSKSNNQWLIVHLHASNIRHDPES